MNGTTATPDPGNSTFAPPFGVAEVAISATSLIILCVFGIFANLLTIITILYSSKLRSPFYLLILSLSISDAVSALISPFALNRLTWGYELWQWPDFFCKFYWSVDIWTSYVTSFHILLFTVIRFVSVQWPFRYQNFTRKRAKICIVVMWVVCFGSGFFPTVLWYGGIKRDRSLSVLQYPSCSLMFERIAQLRLYRKIAYPLFFYIPFALIILLSIAFGLKIVMARKRRSKLFGKRNVSEADLVKKAKEKSQETNRLIQLSVVVGSFLFGYLPRTGYHFYSVNRAITPGSEPYNWWFAFLVYLLLRISECLNPILYNLSSKKMRGETIATLKKLKQILKEKKDSITLTTVAFSKSADSV